MVAVANNRKTFWTERGFYKTIGKKPRLPLRRVTPLATPGMLETELITWLKSQPRIGAPVRRHKRRRSRNQL
jgi:hypothetical protein